MKRMGTASVGLRMCICPQCDKQRMTRPLGHVVSKEKQSYKTKDDNQIELFTDVCNWCKQRNTKKYFEPSRADIRRVLKTMKEDAELDENQTLEDLL